MRFAAPAMLLLMLQIGCGGPSAKVTGTVTCQGKGVPGSILISPKGDGPANTGAAVSGTIKDDGSFEVKLSTVGKHMVVVSPRDRKYPAPPGERDFPCELTPLEREFKAGANTLKIELTEPK